jgi:hypothetical protein
MAWFKAEASDVSEPLGPPRIFKQVSTWKVQGQCLLHGCQQEFSY